MFQQHVSNLHVNGLWLTLHSRGISIVNMDKFDCQVAANQLISTNVEYLSEYLIFHYERIMRFSTGKSG